MRIFHPPIKMSLAESCQRFENNLNYMTSCELQIIFFKYQQNAPITTTGYGYIHGYAIYTLFAGFLMLFPPPSPPKKKKEKKKKCFVLKQSKHFL